MDKSYVIQHCGGWTGATETTPRIDYWYDTETTADKEFIFVEETETEVNPKKEQMAWGAVTAKVDYLRYVESIDEDPWMEYRIVVRTITDETMEY